MATPSINERSLNTCWIVSPSAAEQHDLVVRIDRSVTGTRQRHEHVQFVPIVTF